MFSRRHRAARGCNERQIVLKLILLAADPAVPSPPGLRPGLSEDQITPGVLGFIVTFAIVIAMVFLIRDMVKRIRRVRYRAQVEEGLAAGSHGPNAEYMGIPIMSEQDMKEASYMYDDGAQAPAAPSATAVDTRGDGAARGGASDGTADGAAGTAAKEK